jgi:hypothetical protein
MDHWLHQYLDETCEKIVDVMMIKDVYKPDPRRYNELYRLVKPFLKTISKPTFNEHIKHLLAKHLVKKERPGKQKVQLYLSDDHPMMKIGRQTAADVKKEIAVLESMMEDPEYWVHIPTIISSYFTFCELRKWKLMLNAAFSPRQEVQNLLALTFQMKRFDDLRNLALLRLVRVMHHQNSQEKKEEIQRLLLKSLDKEINEYAEYINKEGKKKGS